MLGFPLLDLIPPDSRIFDRLGNFQAVLAKFFIQLGQNVLQVTDNGEIDPHVLFDGGRIDIDMDDLGVGCKCRDLTGDTVIEAGTDGDQ